MTTLKPIPGRSIYWMIRFNEGVPYVYCWRDVVAYYRDLLESKDRRVDYLEVVNQVKAETNADTYYEHEDFFIRIASLLEAKLGIATCTYQPAIQSFHWGKDRDAFFIQDK